jgi:DMSO/TMAO reductase YedYZ heme-binding membrane subunit
MAAGHTCAERIRIVKQWLHLPVALALAIGALAGAGGCALLLHIAGPGALLAVTGSALPGYVSRAAAITAYVLLTGSMLLGLSITSKTQAGGLINRGDAFALHEFLSWLAWGFVGLHIATLLIDTFQPFSLVDVLIPFASPYRTGAVALGVIGLYLLAVLVTSFYVRRRIGQRTWRAIHFSSFLLFVVATLHGILAGSSSATPAMQLVYLLSGGSVALMLLYRIARSSGRRQPERTPSRSTQVPSI